MTIQAAFVPNREGTKKGVETAHPLGTLIPKELPSFVNPLATVLVALVVDITGRMSTKIPRKNPLGISASGSLPSQRDHAC